jgi:hypothetical protein
MTIRNNKIELTAEENKIFIRQFKSGIIHQLYNEKLLTNDQLNQVLKSINA